MKVLIVTVAGMARRFAESVGHDCLKCMYQSEAFPEGLLPRLLGQAAAVDRVVLVGGFLYRELCETVAARLPQLLPRITFVENTHYSDYGSGYSLYLGLRAAMEGPFDEIVFAEGDLYLDSESFGKVLQADTDVITMSPDPIFANKAVVFYYDARKMLHYLYDTAHQALEIREPFLGVFNSGQVWKFHQPDRVRRAVEEIPAEEWTGTNLVMIQQYFGGLKEDDYQMIPFRKWINCNTAADFLRIGQNDVGGRG